MAKGTLGTTKAKSKLLGVLERQLSPDEKMAGRLLWGNKKFGASFIARTEYLEKGSPDENAARQALARLLYSGKPLHPLLQRWLGLLFDPRAPRHSHDGRMLEIVDREDGRRLRLDQQIAEFIELHRWRLIDSRQEKKVFQKELIAMAREYFRLSREAIYKALKRHRSRK